MFQRIDTVENVWLISVDGANFAHLTTGPSLKKSLYLNKRLIKEPPLSSSFELENSKLIFSTLENEAFILDITTDKPPTLLTKHRIIPKIFNENKVITMPPPGINAHWKFLNIATQKQSPCSTKGIVYGDVIFTIDSSRTEIGLFDIIKEQPLPNLDIKDHQKFINKGTEPLRVSEQWFIKDTPFLVLAINRQALLIYDYKSSTIKQIINQNHHNTGMAIATAKGYYDDHIFSVYETTCWRLHIHTGKLEIFDLTEEFAKNNVSPIAGGEISCIDNYALIASYSLDDKTKGMQIFALNLDTLKVEWVYKFSRDEMGYGIKQPVTSGSYMYVQSENKNLHIFQYANQ